MSETVKVILAMLGLLLGVPLALLFVRDYFTRPSKRKIEEYSRQFTERLRHPDFTAVEKYFGRPLPDSVRALYADTQELMRGDFEVARCTDAPQAERWYVAFYQPADGLSVRDNWPGLDKYFAFADDGCGNEYLVDPRKSDPAVLFHDHESGKISAVCERFTEFMKWPRLGVRP